jgi:hypothetical protein
MPRHLESDSPVFLVVIGGTAVLTLLEGGGEDTQVSVTLRSGSLTRLGPKASKCARAIVGGGGAEAGGAVLMTLRAVTRTVDTLTGDELKWSEERRRKSPASKSRKGSPKQV